jgi:hypothetical protein
MPKPRKNLPLKTKLASALLTIRRPNENGELVPVISFEEAQKLTAEQIISRFEFNHYPVPHAFDGPAEPWNLDPTPKAEHREITAKIDVPRIAKAKRVGKAEEEFRRRLLAKASPDAELDRQAGKAKRKWPKRSFGRKKEACDGS